MIGIKKQIFNDVEKNLFKLISSKRKKNLLITLISFFSIEKEKNFEYIPLGLYEDYNLSL
ncbi:MAG: hypothetical protein L6V91_06780 [Bacilli bacterium]|nr:MAG: hypothetical protein L6V91_06780 [Bacilli bacterium]